MCIGCHWANYRDYFASPSPQIRSGLTRRDALRRGALFTATAVAAASAAPSFIAEAVAANEGSADIVFRNGPVYTVDGKILLPGFVEGHTHPLVGSTLTRGADLQFDTRKAMIGALKAYRETAPDQIHKTKVVMTVMNGQIRHG